MNENRKETSMSGRIAPINLNQGTTKKMSKTHMGVHDKGIQKCTMLDRDGVQIRDRPDGMARNPKKEIMSLS